MTCPKAGRDHRTGDLAAQVLTGRLSAAGPTEFEAEFGIDLAAEAGAVTPRARWARTPRGGRDPPPALDPLPPPARVPCLDRHPGERDAPAGLLAGLDADAEPTSRTTLPAHVTCSAVVIDRHRRVLHVRHKASGRRLLAPGGHVEADDDTLLAAALREVMEGPGSQPRLSSFDLIDQMPPPPVLELDGKHGTRQLARPHPDEDEIHACMDSDTRAARIRVLSTLTVRKFTHLWRADEIARALRPVFTAPTEEAALENETAALKCVYVVIMQPQPPWGVLAWSRQKPQPARGWGFSGWCVSVSGWSRPRRRRLVYASADRTASGSPLMGWVSAAG